jgi:hypothetical protein
MDTVRITSVVGSDGVLQFTLPLDPSDANREVQITVEPVQPARMSAQDWRNRVLDTAGKWQGEFERPDAGDYEVREPMS